jgi:hypothetical protein
MSKPKVDKSKKKAKPVTGTCCACGYSGSEVSDCPKMEDGVHCNHWHDGDDEEKGGAK